MPDLNFQVCGCEAVAYAASPLLALKVEIANMYAEEPVHTISLRCQIQIEPTRRRYSAEEQPRLLDLFGDPSRWTHTLRRILWAHVNVSVPPFAGEIEIELPVPCTFDFNVAATKYFAGLEAGEIPVILQFSGTIFYARPDGMLQVAQIPWKEETRYRLPVTVWRRMMARYYPNSTWFRLRHDVFAQLYEYKVRHGIPTWEQVIERLLSPLDPPMDTPPEEPNEEDPDPKEVIH
ncbi:MAG: DUF6084 family protein [Blastocatellia bacterium]|nr:DUF6084 family protein [Blastocatellia bacterium]